MKGFLLLLKKHNKKNIKGNSTSERTKKLISIYGPLFISICLFLAIIEILLYKEAIIKSMPGSPRTIPVNLLQHAYPILSSVLGSSTIADTSAVNITPILSAQAAIIMDDDSKVILYAKNSGIRFSMASTTKIMTAITALHYFPLDYPMTVYTDSVEGATVGFKKGEKVSFEDMLYGLLLPSGNDAAIAIAENFPGGKDAFVMKMNENAQKFHLYNTHYADPAGLDDEGDYTTVVDLARLASIAMKNNIFATIVGTKKRIITTNIGSYTVYNLNKLLGTDGVVGIKTGFTDQAGEVLVTSKKEQGHQLLIVVMKSKDRFGDTKKILSFIEGNIEYVPLQAN